MGELLVGKGLGGYVDEVTFCGVAVLPEESIAWGIGEAVEFADGFGEHGRVVAAANDPVAPRVLLQERRGEAVVAEASAALPVDRFGDAPFIFAVDDFFEPGDYVGVAVLAEFDHDPTSAHLMGDSAGGAGTGEGV